MLISKRFAERLTKKHLKRYRRPLPGYLQLDIKYVPYKVNGEQWYQISCVDHHSSWRLVRLYRTKCISSALKFLEELKGKCPSPIIEIQTDNDATFTDKFTSLRGVTGEHPFDVWCKENGIRHKLIPVGQKELNGKIENCHKQDDRGFYSQGQYYSFDQMALNMTGYSKRWNTQRPLSRWRCLL